MREVKLEIPFISNQPDGGQSQPTNRPYAAQVDLNTGRRPVTDDVACTTAACFNHRARVQ